MPNGLDAVGFKEAWLQLCSADANAGKSLSAADATACEEANSKEAEHIYRRLICGDDSRYDRHYPPQSTSALVTVGYASRSWQSESALWCESRASIDAMLCALCARCTGIAVEEPDTSPVR